MKEKTRFWLSLGIFGVPVLVVWADLVANVFLGQGFLKLGFWWF